MLLKRLSVWALLLVVAVAGCSRPPEVSSSLDPPAKGQEPWSVPPTPAGLAAFYSQKIQWNDCKSGFQCGRLEVPVDYAQPDGSKISLALIRKPTSDRDGRKGSLILNPGGPGGSGIEYAQAVDRVVSPPVRARFDVVGFDPRGVGESAPINCLSTSETDALIAADPTPDNAAEIQESQRLYRELGAACAKSGGELLKHVDTVSVARDLDILRAALGDRRLFYLGKSYGTYIGAVYAKYFPKNVGRVVLDGALDPALGGSALNLGQAAGFERATRNFVADCVAAPSCPLGSEQDLGLERLRALIAGLDQTPLATDDPARPLTEGLGSLGVAVAMYDEGAWPTLRTALAAASGGKGQPLLDLADIYSGRESGSYPNNQNTIIYAVNCLDRPDIRTVAQVQAELPTFEKQAPTWGPFLAWGQLSCADWPVPGKSQPEKITAAGSAPILVVGTTADPATPYAWSQSLADQLESGRLLTYEGDGHTAYMRGSRCIDAATNAYLLAAKLPSEGKRCS